MNLNEAYFSKPSKKKAMKQTMFIGGDWYYWNKDKKQWLPESYKFEETK